MEGADRAEGFLREVMGSVWCGPVPAWERFAIKKSVARSVFADADHVRQFGTDGGWEHETPYKEEQEFLRHSFDLRSKSSQCAKLTMREVRRLGKLLGSILGKWQAQRMDKCAGENCFNEVVLADEDRQNCTGYSAQMHGFLEADHRASRRRSGRGHLVVRVLSLTPIPAGRLHVVGLVGALQEAVQCGGVRRAAASAIGRPWTESWPCTTARTAEKQTCFERTLRRTEFATTCSMRSSSWQTCRKMVTQGLQERRRLKIMDGLRRFIMVDNHEVVKVGELDKNMESMKVVKPNFTTDFSEAVIREGADELTLRAEEEGVLHTLLTPRMWETADRGLRQWMRTGTPSVRSFSKVSKDQNGKPCTTITRSCTKRSHVRDLEKTRRPRHFGL